MNTYGVELRRKYSGCLSTYVEVEAENESDAIRQALLLTDNDDDCWSVDFGGEGDLGEPELVSVNGL